MMRPTARNKGKSRLWGWLAITVAPIAVLVALILQLLSRKRTQDKTAAEIAITLRNFIERSGGDWDWDDFSSIPITDPVLDQIRREAAIAGPPNADMAKLKELLRRAEALVVSEVLESVRNLIKAADADQSLSVPVSQFVAATSIIPVRNLGEWERAIRKEIHYTSQPLGRIRRSSLPAGQQFSVPWLDLFSSDGYRRERVMRATEEGVPNAFLFAILVRRLNDWVPQVRAAARETVPAIAAKTNPEYILEALWEIIPRLHTWRRLQPNERGIATDLLCQDAVLERFVSKIIETASGPAASILSQAIRNPNLDRRLVQIAKSAVQPGVRAKAYRTLLENRAVWLEGREWIWTDKSFCEGRYQAKIGERIIVGEHSLFEALRDASADKSPLVRRVAASALIARRKDFGSKAMMFAEALSRDRYPSVAERGRFAMEKIVAGN